MQLSETAISELQEILHQETGESFEHAETQEIGELFLTVVAESLKVRARSQQHS